MNTYSTDEVCEILGRSKPTVLKYIKEGTLPCATTKKVGRGGFRFTKEDIEKCAERLVIIPNYEKVNVRPSINLDEQTLKILRLKALKSATRYEISKDPKDKITMIEDLIAVEEFKLKIAAKDHVGI